MIEVIATKVILFLLYASAFLTIAYQNYKYPNTRATSSIGNKNNYLNDNSYNHHLYEIQSNGENQIGVATNWLNPYMTRYTTTQKATTKEKSKIKRRANKRHSNTVLMNKLLNFEYEDERMISAYIK